MYIHIYLSVCLFTFVLYFFNVYIYIYILFGQPLAPLGYWTRELRLLPVWCCQLQVGFLAVSGRRVCFRVWVAEL